MKIALYGATGMIGSQIAAEAARRGHEVTALSRTRGELPEGVTWQQGDASDTAAVAAVASAHDAVIAAFGPSRAAGGDPASFIELFVPFAEAVGTTRLVVIGGAGSLYAAPDTRLVDLPEFPDAYKAEALAHAEALYWLRDARPDLDWSYLSPAPEIAPGERTGAYTTGDESPAGSFISSADLAIAVVDELQTPAHRRARWTVASR